MSRSSKHISFSSQPLQVGRRIQAEWEVFPNQSLLVWKTFNSGDSSLATRSSAFHKQPKDRRRGPTTTACSVGKSFVGSGLFSTIHGGESSLSLMRVLVN